MRDPCNECRFMLYGICGNPKIPSCPCSQCLIKMMCKDACEEAHIYYKSLSHIEEGGQLKVFYREKEVNTRRNKIE